MKALTVGVDKKGARERGCTFEGSGDGKGSCGWVCGHCLRRLRLEQMLEARGCFSSLCSLFALLSFHFPSTGFFLLIYLILICFF